MNSFANVAKNIGNQTTTTNGAIAYKSTNGGVLLDFYAKIGGMRNREATDIINDWKAARRENSVLADNLVLYARNIRTAGLGERRIGRILLKELAKLDPDKVKRNFDTIVDTGRWDDLFVLIGTPVEDAMWNFIEKQLIEDINGMRENRPISIMAKWLKSINTSSNESRKIAKLTCKKLGISEKTYRQTLSRLRKYIDVVERKMSAGEWDSINFETVPSVAMSRYIKTYNKHCQERFEAYKTSLEKGEAKVNASTLYPYDIVEKYLYTNHGRLDIVDEAQWKALPNYVNGEYDVVCMCDVSGSMTGKPMATSIGLGTYFAQRNRGAYHNLYMTFSRQPRFISLQDNWSLKSCLDTVASTGMGYNTDLDSAMKLIYDTAVVSREVPKAIVIISDGQFDWDYRADRADSIVGKWNKALRAAGLPETKVISWNVNALKDNYIGTVNDNISYCSGSGVGPFNDLLGLIENNAYEAMVKILSKPEFTWK